MFKVFRVVLFKTFSVIRREPIILAPYLLFSLLLTIFLQIGSLKDNMWLFALMEWLIPILLIQPFVTLLSISTIKGSTINLRSVFASISNSLRDLFIISLTYKPIIFFGALKLSAFDFSNQNISEVVPLKELYFIFVLALLGIIIATLLTFFYPVYFCSKSNKQTKLSGKIKRSLQLFLRFKWITISFTLYFFFVFLFFKLIFLQVLLAILPTHLHQLFIQLTHGIERSIFYVFILRLFYYLNSMISLNDN